jgi:hypothetical protein
MPTYRVGSPLGREANGKTPHALVCEACNEELEAVVPAERGQDKFCGLTAAGVGRIWPNLEAAVKAHEGRCQGKRH